MNLRQLQEAKYYKPMRLAYYEIIEGRMGDTDIRKAVVTDQDLKKAAMDEDALGDLADEHGMWSLGEVLSNSLDQIMKTVAKEGGWSSMTEEGSVGISKKGMKHAGLLAKAAFVQDDGDEDEDW